jgi:sugar/nucleoside kinase (ribokinase family)
MKQDRSGIIAGGNWIVDHIKMVDHYPEQGALAHILSQSINTGGSPYNILKGLAKLGADFKLSGVGLVGNDTNGHYILDDCIKNGIDKRMIRMVDGQSTAFTDVVTVKTTGKRTFFHHRGVNNQLKNIHFRLEKFKKKIFHLGYLVLLEGMDQLDAAGRTQASLLFEKAQEIGLKTSADFLSVDPQITQAIVKPSLPFLNYLFLNQHEAADLTGLQSADEMYQAACLIVDWGVKEWVIIELDEAIMAVNNQKESFLQGKSRIPDELVVSETGVGEAIAAGVLWGLHENLSINDCLLLAAAAAGCCMLHESCCDGILPIEQTLQTARSWGFFAV